MKARALLDIPHHGIKAGQFFEADEALVKNFVNSGDADDQAQEAEVYGANIPKAKIIAAAFPEVDTTNEPPTDEKPKGKK